MTTSLFAAALFLLHQPFAQRALGEPAAPAKSTAAAPSVEASTDTDKTLSVSDLYKAVRDPFVPVSAASIMPASPAKPAAGSPEAAAESAAPFAEEEPSQPEFSIHFLSLKGIMKDRHGASAILVHEKTGQGYLLRGGKLYDYKNNRIPGVTGTVKHKEKTVILMTPDKDVQPLFLGEVGDPAEKKDKAVKPEPGPMAPALTLPAAPSEPEGKRIR
jgi:hypothetical protein